MRVCRFTVLTLLLAASCSASALNGWDKSIQNQALVYVPSDLAKDKLFEYTFYGPIKLGGSDYEAWFRDTTLALQQKLGKPQGSWEVKHDKDKWSVTSFYVDQSGTKLQSAYESGKLQNGHVYLMNLRSNLGVFALVKYGFAYDDLLAEVETQLSDKPAINFAVATKSSGTQTVQNQAAQTQTNRQPANSPKASKLTGKERRQAIEKAIRVAPGKGVESSDIETLWVNSELDLIWGGVDLKTYLLLKDGSVYSRCKIPPNELNVAASRELQPKNWSKWRKSWGKYEIKNSKTGEWEELPGSEAGAVRDGTVLSGSYLNAGGSQYSGSWKKTITFHKNGRFELSSSVLRSNSGTGGGDSAPLATVSSKSDKQGTSTATSVVGANVGGGSSSKKKDGAKNTGRYQVKNHTITLVHDDGWQHNELLLYENRDKKSALVYGDDIYYYDDD